MDEIDAEIESRQRSADGLFISNPKVIEDYEARKEKIETLEKEIDDRKNNLERDNDEIKDLEVCTCAPQKLILQDTWLPSLEELVNSISEKFSEYMRRIGCVGEVGLKKEEDYNNWGIQIKV